MTLIGKWFIVGDVNEKNEEYAMMGEIISRVNDNCVLVRIKPTNGPAPQMVLHIEYLATDNAVLFDSEEDMQDWIEFSETKPEFKLLKLKGTTT